jgi:hypothetical protein
MKARPKRARSLILAVACVAVVVGIFGDAAFADAPDPVLASTVGTVVANPDGTKTLTLTGSWAWTTRDSNCNLDKRAVGFAVDWNDSTQPGNPITAKIDHVNVTIDVGALAANSRNPADNAVHPTPPIPPPGPPVFGGCGTYSSSLDYNTGTWGPISHTYPAGTTSFNVCAIMYDVHLVSNGGAPNKAKETVAGGPDHNGDNGFQKNKDTPLGNGCFLRTVPTLTTTASPSVSVGNAIFDTATLAGGASTPTGSITFKAFTNSNCTGLVFTNTKSVSGNGTYVSDSFVPATSGLYYWVASYSGDTHNTASDAPCDDPAERVLVTSLTPSLVTDASPNIALGGSISDAGFISGATATAGGSILFKLYGPDDATCSGTPAYTNTVLVSGNGTYGSGSFTPSAPGTYRWVATYSGDVNNIGSVTACGDVDETVVVRTLDTGAPLCVFGGFSDGGHTIHVTVGDTESGLASVVPVTTNANANVPVFAPGTTLSVDVTATKIDVTSGATLQLTVTDLDGNVTVCDPVVPGSVKRALRPGVQRLRGLDAIQSRIVIRNGAPGLDRVVVSVNGQRFKVSLRRTGAVARLNVLAAMRPGHRNVITVRSFGRSHASASLLVGS